jgi:hypothetical protein
VWGRKKDCPQSLRVNWRLKVPLRAAGFPKPMTDSKRELLRESRVWVKGKNAAATVWFRNLARIEQCHPANSPYHGLP